jgi:hypothetical protein
LIQKGDFSRDELVAEIHAALNNKQQAADAEDRPDPIDIEDFSPSTGPVNGAGEPIDEFGAGR